MQIIAIPSVLEIFFFVAPKIHTTTENTTKTMMSITFSPISCNGLIADAIPSTIRMLKILEPIAFPTAISTSFFLAATMDVTSSGRDVPIETIVNPTRFWLIPKSMAILLAASTVRSPPNAMAAAPPTIHNRLFGSCCSNAVSAGNPLPTSLAK